MRLLLAAVACLAALASPCVAQPSTAKAVSTGGVASAIAGPGESVVSYAGPGLLNATGGLLNATGGLLNTTNTSAVLDAALKAALEAHSSAMGLLADQLRNSSLLNILDVDGDGDVTPADLELLMSRTTPLLPGVPTPAGLPGLPAEINPSDIASLLADAAASIPLAAIASCRGRCGGASGFCFCDKWCATTRDCCADFEAVCEVQLNFNTYYDYGDEVFTPIAQPAVAKAVAGPGGSASAQQVGPGTTVDIDTGGSDAPQEKSSGGGALESLDDVGGASNDAPDVADSGGGPETLIPGAAIAGMIIAAAAGISLACFAYRRRVRSQAAARYNIMRSSVNFRDENGVAGGGPPQPEGKVQVSGDVL